MMKRLFQIMAGLFLVAQVWAVDDPAVGVGTIMGSTGVPGSDSYATSSDRFHLGGWHSGGETNELVDYVQKEGMAFWSTNLSKLFILQSGTWVEFSGGFGSITVVGDNTYTTNSGSSSNVVIDLTASTKASLVKADGALSRLTGGSVTGAVSIIGSALGTNVVYIVGAGDSDYNGTYTWSTVDGYYTGPGGEMKNAAGVWGIGTEGVHGVPFYVCFSGFPVTWTTNDPSSTAPAPTGAFASSNGVVSLVDGTVDAESVSANDMTLNGVRRTSWPSGIQDSDDVTWTGVHVFTNQVSANATFYVNYISITNSFIPTNSTDTAGLLGAIRAFID